MISSILITILPMVVAATVNTALVKLPAFSQLRAPIDGGRLLRDDKRLFGDNKTWLGFIGLIIWGAVFFWLWAYISTSHQSLIDQNFFSSLYTTAGLPALLTGAAMGFAYALFELPNSYWKRRVDIRPGETHGGMNGLLHIVVDHSDSIIGCAVVIALLGSISLAEWLVLIVIGVVVHLLVNYLLVLVKVKKTI